MNETVSFHRMIDGTRADYLLLDEYERQYTTRLTDRVLDALRKLDHGAEGYQISRLDHSLQVATRARHDDADEELIVAGLLHDIGDDLAPYNHAAVAAAILRPYVREEVTWIVEKHEIFQRYYYAHHVGRDRNARDAFAGHKWYSACEAFCERWDQASFDPSYPTEPLEVFEPMVRRILSRTAYDPQYIAR